MHHEDEGTRFAWFLAGTALGAAAALLWAPAPGRETRDQLRRRAGEGRERLAERGREAMERGSEIYERGREMAEDAGRSGRDLYERGREVAHNIRRKPADEADPAPASAPVAEEQAEGAAG